MAHVFAPVRLVTYGLPSRRAGEIFEGCMRSARRTGIGVAVVTGFGAVLITLCGMDGALGASHTPSVTYVACIELTGGRETSRDLKLRQGACHKNERRIAWPPNG